MKARTISSVLLAAMALLLLFSAEAADAVQQGLQLCAGSVIPSLFPFLVLSSLFFSVSSSLSDNFLQRAAAGFLGCSPSGIAVFFLSLLGGYPVGARLIAQLYRAHQLSREEAAYLLHFCNNAGPAFLLGFVGLGQFGSLRIGVFLYLIHASVAAVLALLFRPKITIFSAKTAVLSVSRPVSESFVSAIGEAGSTMVQICAFVTFFYTVLQLFSSLTGLSHPMLLGFVEITGGLAQLSAGRSGFVMACGLVGWGGISVHCQTAAVLSGTGLPMREYLYGKLLHGIFSAFAGFFAWNLL